MRKTVQAIYEAPASHWVGNGFPVRTLMDYHRHGSHISPFLLLDHAGPHDFAPGQGKRGVGAHPHRGFETVTIVYDGEVSHRDTTGAGGTIRAGDVQWMTAAGGLLHEEYHSEAFVQQGGRLEMVQLWVNLPARHKREAPAYQALERADIPQLALPEDAGWVRVIAGQYQGQAGAARIHTPMNVWDVRLRAQGSAALQLPQGHTLMVLVIAGSVRVQGHMVHARQWVQLSRSGTGLHLEALTDAKLLVLGGEPIAEPVVGQGPFVMNTREELAQAYDDFLAGHFGQMSPPV